MRAIDEIYTECPFYGTRRIKHILYRDHSLSAGRRHIRRLMRVMGIEALYPKRRPATSLGDGTAPFPYLLADLPITRVNHVWGVDITYIRLTTGFVYLVAFIDWYSRFVVSWSVSETMETAFCTETLEHALLMAHPEIHNSDQGSQFTSQAYTARLKEHPDIQISMDGRGRCFDNIFTERLWRSVKYEDIYLKEYETIHAVREGLRRYFIFYNLQRPHQSLDYQTPAEVFFGKNEKRRFSLPKIKPHLY
jgi:putative transposase